MIGETQIEFQCVFPGILNSLKQKGEVKGHCRQHGKPHTSKQGNTLAFTLLTICEALS